MYYQTLSIEFIARGIFRDAFKMNNKLITRQASLETLYSEIKRQYMNIEKSSISGLRNASDQWGKFENLVNLCFSASIDQLDILNDQKLGFDHFFTQVSLEDIYNEVKRIKTELNLSNLESKYMFMVSCLIVYLNHINRVNDSILDIKTKYNKKQHVSELRIILDNEIRNIKRGGKHKKLDSQQNLIRRIGNPIDILKQMRKYLGRNKEGSHNLSRLATELHRIIMKKVEVKNDKLPLLFSLFSTIYPEKEWLTKNEFEDDPRYDGKYLRYMEGQIKSILGKWYNSRLD